MKMAIIGWGSLIWNSGELQLASQWLRNGPILPIEFSRVSGDGRLTLVIDELNGAEVITRYAVSRQSDFGSAIHDLMRREGTTKREFIGSVRSASTDGDPESIGSRIALWCSEAKLDGAIWTALPANFAERRNTKFTVAAAMDYLCGLTGETRQKAIEYIVRAPEEVVTPFRRAFDASGLGNEH